MDDERNIVHESHLWCSVVHVAFNCHPRHCGTCNAYRIETEFYESNSGKYIPIPLPLRVTELEHQKYWCFVNAAYLEWRLLGEYLWMWLALFLSCLIYIPLYLWMRGYIISDPSSLWKWRLKSSKDSDPCRQARRRLSLIMLV